MKSENYTYHRFVVVFVAFSAAFASSCDEESRSIEPTAVNSFKMIVNGVLWEPSVIDPCHKTFQCAWSALNDKPFYNISAYRDPHNSTSLFSENSFSMQLMDASRAGVYPINGSFLQNFESYATFVINDGGGKTVYQNKKNGNSFHVEIIELFHSQLTSVVGIQGAFSGVVYNIDNPLDSIVIDKGDFLFKKLNRYDFNHCH